MSIKTLGKCLSVQVLALSLVAAPAWAQERLDFPAGEPYVHPHSTIEVPATLSGYDRTQVYQYIDDALDVGLNFRSPDEKQLLSVYIFRNTNGSVPVWFAQAEAVILAGDAFDNPVAEIGPVSFTPPGSGQASGLIAVFQPGPASRYESTGVALQSMGEWYVKLRATSATQSPAQLYHLMTGALAELTVPQSDTQVVAPLSDCTEPLAFGKASRDARGDAADNIVAGLIGSVMGDIVKEKQAKSAKAPVFCRDAASRPAEGIYRPDGSKERYLVALGDNGNGVEVGPEMRIEGISPGNARKPRYPIILHTANSDVNLMPQDRLPSPARVNELLQSERVVSEQATWGDERPIQVRTDALK